jgi:hypothetical protein
MRRRKNNRISLRYTPSKSADRGGALLCGVYGVAAAFTEASIAGDYGSFNYAFTVSVESGLLSGGARANLAGEAVTIGIEPGAALAFRGRGSGGAQGVGLVGGELSG